MQYKLIAAVAAGYASFIRAVLRRAERPTRGSGEGSRAWAGDCEPQCALVCMSKAVDCRAEETRWVSYAGGAADLPSNTQRINRQTNADIRCNHFTRCDCCPLSSQLQESGDRRRVDRRAPATAAAWSHWGSTCRRAGGLTSCAARWRCRNHKGKFWCIPRTNPLTASAADA